MRSRRTVGIAIGAALVVIIVIVLLVGRSAGHGTNTATPPPSTANSATAAPITRTPLSAAPTSVTGRYAVTTTAPRPQQTTSVSATAPPGLGTISVSSLPDEARTTLALIAAGGPYPYRQDDVVWENREGRLPKHKRGYYHEYTVVTPGSPDRGARRIITGAGGEHYYTADHYGSFKLVVEQ